MWSAKLIMMNLGKAVLVLGTLRLQSLGAVSCEISEKLFPGKPLYLEVRLWNERVIHCYEKAGFQITGEPFAQVTGLGPGIFVRMERK